MTTIYRWTLWQQCKCILSLLCSLCLNSSGYEPFVRLVDFNININTIWRMLLFKMQFRLPIPSPYLTWKWTRVVILFVSMSPRAGGGLEGVVVVQPLMGMNWMASHTQRCGRSSSSSSGIELSGDGKSLFLTDCFSFVALICFAVCKACDENPSGSSNGRLIAPNRFNPVPGRIPLSHASNPPSSALLLAPLFTARSSPGR